MNIQSLFRFSPLLLSTFVGASACGGLEPSASNASTSDALRSSNPTPSRLRGTPSPTAVRERLSLAELRARSASDDVVVAANQDVTIDASITLGFIKVLGRLNCAAGFVGQVRIDGILIMGADAKFSCGKENKRFSGKAEFILRNNRELSELITNPPHLMGGKAIVAMNGGRIALFGQIAKAKYTRLSSHLSVGQTSISVASPVGWSAGDQVVVATTSFYQDQSELFSVQSADNGKIDFLESANNFHYGQTQEYSDQADGEKYEVDERAYVANLTRNIVIMSEDDQYTAQQIGAQMMVMHEGHAKVDGVEFFRVGQMGSMGRYPFHWHKPGNVDGQFIKNSSIHESYNRCVTIHGAHQATVKGNVCFDHFGHGYFLEDGNETKNVIQYNLAIQSKKVPQARALLKSDFNLQPADRFPGPASYWISNPDNDVRFNVAVGSEGSGFWMAFKKYLFCDETGCVQGNQNNANVFPLTTDTLAFSDNVAQSTVCGITWDGAPDGALTNNPLNPADRALSSAHYAPATTATFSNLSVYKSARAGIYFRGEQAHFANAVFADNGTSAFFAYNQLIHDSIMVGFSDNHSDSELGYHYNNNINSQNRHRQPFEGIRVYDGPFVLDNVFFAGFSATPIYWNGTREVTPTPITMTGGASRFVNSVKHVTFSPQPLRKFWMKLGTSWQDDYSPGVLDIEGDLTGTAGAIIRPDHGMNEHSNCQTLSNEEALVCAYEISHLKIYAGGASNLQEFDVRRSDGPSFSFDPNAQSGVNLNKFSMIMNEDISYLMSDVNFMNNSQLNLFFSSRRLGDVSPIIGIISGQNMTCAVSELRLSEGIAVRSLAALRQVQETAYTVRNGRFYFKVHADSTRSNITPESPQGRNQLSVNCP